jgi:hypothetical protein
MLRIRTVLRRLAASVAFAFIVVAPAPASAQPGSAFGINPADYSTLTLRIVELIHVATNGSNQAFLQLHSQLYAPVVRYYGKQISAAEALQRKAAWAERWPRRNYYLEPGSILVFCAQQEHTCEAQVDVDFTAEAPERGDRSSGRWRAEYAFDFSTGRPLLFRENGRIVFRR